jgi:hypothetical protein
VLPAAPGAGRGMTLAILVHRYFFSMQALLKNREASVDN